MGAVRDIAPVSLGLDFDGRSGPCPTASRPTESEAFQAFWRCWPPARRIDKRRTLRAWTSALRRGLTEKRMLTGAVAYHARMMAERTPLGYIVHPATFVNNDRWEAEEARMTPGTSSSPSLGTTSPRAEWVCRHDPPCRSRTTCAVVRSRTCDHDPPHTDRVACLEQCLREFS